VARFRLFAALAAALLAFELGRSRRRREAEREAGTPLHSEGAAAAALLALLMVACAAAPARAQSDWARGDHAFRVGRFGAAESLYSRRLAHGGPPAVRVNLATARARAGDPARAVQELGQLAAPDTPAGHAAGYNAGTLLGEQNQIDPALAALRKELERNPDDQDARWNYELLLRRKQEQKPPPQPKSGRGGGGGGGGGQAQNPQPRSGAGPRQQAPQPQPRSASGPPQPAGAGAGMSRQQADQLLGALEELSRQEQERQRRVKVTTERRGRDW
jgi:Ca-activated chloride channel homolog